MATSALTTLDVLAAVAQGTRPVAHCNRGIGTLEGAYAEPGMRARIVGARLMNGMGGAGDVVILDFDYSEFEAHNEVFETSNYFDRAGSPRLTAREAGYYQQVEQLYFSPDDLAEKFFGLDGERERETALLLEYGAARAAGTGNGAQAPSYVQWIEQELLQARDALEEMLIDAPEEEQPTSTTREREK